MAVTRAQTGLGSSPRYPLRSRTGPPQRRGPTPTIGQDQKPEDATADEENTGRTKRSRRGKKETPRILDMDIQDDTVAFVSDQEDGDNPMFDAQPDPILPGSEHLEETENSPEGTHVNNDEAGEGKLVSDESLPDVRGNVEQPSDSKKRKREAEATDSVAMIRVDPSCSNTVNEMMGYLDCDRFDMYHLCTLQLLAEVMNREELKKRLPSLTKQVLKGVMDDVEPMNESERPREVFMGFPDEGADDERDRCWKQWCKLYTGFGKAMDELELLRHPAFRDLDTQKIPESIDGLNEAERTLLFRRTFSPRANAYNQGMRMHEEFIREEKDWVNGILKDIYDKKQQAYDIRGTGKQAQKENQGEEPQGQSKEVREIKDLKCQIQRLQADIKTKDESITKLQETGQKDEPQAKQLTEQLEAARDEASKLQLEVTEAKHEANETKRDKKVIEAEMKAYKKFSAEKGEKIRKLETEAINNQNENKMLQVKVDSNKHLSEEMKVQAKKISRLESQLRSKEDEIAQNNNDITNKDKDHEILERELNEKLEHQKQKTEELKIKLDQEGSATSKMKAKTSELEHQIRLLQVKRRGVDESSEELLSNLRCQVDELERRADDLKAELRDTQETSLQQSSETSRLEERVRALTDDVERKDNEIENQKSEIEKRGKAISQHREEENESRNKIRMLNQSLNEKTRDIEEQVDESRRKADELEEARAELKATKLELEERDKGNKENITQLEDRERSYREMKTKLGQVEKELEARKFKLEIEEKERKKHENTLEEKAKELQGKKTELEEKDTELEKKSHEIRQKEDTIEILQGKLKEMESIGHATQMSASKAEQLEKRVEELTSKSVSLENDLANTKNNEKMMEAQRKEIDSLKADRDRMREEMREKSKESTELKAALEQQREEVIKVVADAEIQGTQPTGDLASLLGHIFEKLKEEKKKSEEREERMKKDKECWLQEKEDLTSRINDDDTGKEHTVQELEREVKESQAQNECLRKELENLKTKNLDILQESESQRNDLEGKELQLEIARERNKKVQDDHKRALAEKIGGHDRALAEQKQTHEMAFAREKEGHKRELATIQAYAETLQVSLQESRAQKEQEKQEYEIRVQQLRRELNEACATRDRIHKQLENRGPGNDIISPATIASRLSGAREDTESYETRLPSQAQRLDHLNSNHRETAAQTEESSTMKVGGGVRLLQSVDQTSGKLNNRLGTHDIEGEMEAKTFTEPQSQPLCDSKRDRGINGPSYLDQWNHHPPTKETTIMTQSQVTENLRAGNILSPCREGNTNATAREQRALPHGGKAEPEEANRDKERNGARRNSPQFPLLSQSTGLGHGILQREQQNTGTGTAPGESTYENQKQTLLQTSTAVQKLVDQAASHNYSTRKGQVVRKGEARYPETWTFHKPENRPLEGGEFVAGLQRMSDIDQAMRAIQGALSELMYFTQGAYGNSRTTLPSSNDYVAPNRKLMDFVSEKAKDSHESIEVKTKPNQSDASSKGATPALGSSAPRKRTPPQEEDSDTVEESPSKRPRSRAGKNSYQGSKPHKQPARRGARQTTDKYEIKITYKSKTERFSVESVRKGEASTTYKVELYNKSSHVRYNIPLLQLLALGTKDTAAKNALKLREFFRDKDIMLHDALAVTKIRRTANKKRSFNVTFDHAHSSEDDGSPDKRVLQASMLLPWGYHIAELMGGEFVQEFEESKQSYIEKGLGKLGLQSVSHS